jgi:serine/threonine-protein kinase
MNAGFDPARFAREARLQGQLEHPAIVPVYDIGVDDAGSLWFTMKRVRGLTLEQVLEGLERREPTIVARYSRSRLLHALCTVCLAVDFAHKRGVLHRDIKPGNIMLGDFGEVHLLDWGVACLFGSKEVDLVGLPPPDIGETAVGSVVGTAGYMSPEQARGEVDRLDARTDVYALGAVLFEILTLSQLAPRSNPIKMLAETIEGIEARPSVRCPERDVPPELEDLCVRATSTDRDHRIASARELSDAIERFLDGDRDVERRRALAEEQIDAGRRAVERALKPGAAGLEARADAMRALTRAIALDPARSDAAALMARLLMEPPVDTPVGVEKELAAIVQSERLQGVRWSLLSNALWIAVAPFFLWMGIRDATFLVPSAALFGAVTAIAVWHLRRKHVTGVSGLVQLVLTALLVMTQRALFGSSMIVPTLTLAIGVFFALLGGAENRRHRVGVVAGASLTVVIPAILEWVGVLPDAYSIARTHFDVAPQLVWFEPVPTRLFLIVSSVLAIAIPLILIIRSRATMSAAERRLLLHAWHLRQLVPESGAV